MMPFMDPSGGAPLVGDLGSRRCDGGKAMPLMGLYLARREPSYRRMRAAVSSGQPEAMSLRARARSIWESSAMSTARAKSKPRRTNWSSRQKQVRRASSD
jgi:hypothetical protein